MKVSCRASGRTVVLIAGIRHQRFRTTEESLKFPGERVHLASRSRAMTTRLVSSVVLKKRTAKSDPKERSLWHLRR